MDFAPEGLNLETVDSDDQYCDRTWYRPKSVGVIIALDS